MIFQGGALLDSSTVIENVKLPLDLFTNQSEEEKMERVNCLRRVKLEGAHSKYPAELSGGMVKRVAIARVVMNLGTYSATSLTLDSTHRPLS